MNDETITMIMMRAKTHTVTNVTLTSVVKIWSAVLPPFHLSTTSLRRANWPYRAAVCSS